jgi:hypothetical protein
VNGMDERLQAYLDGELPLEALPAELRARAEEWDGLLARVRETAPAGAPLGLDRRVMAALQDRRRSRGPAWLAWLLRPRPLPVSPLAAAAAVALVALAVARPWSGPAADDGSVAGRVYVQFVVDAPGARSVHLAGDFSDWQPGVALSDPEGDGTWTARVPLEPGVHEYMFVIDGSRWVPDPNALTSTDDGFGRRNSVLAVAPANGT